MWTTSPKFVRFSIARFMWSLRNSPYYADLQPFWAIYAPRGPLADVMWNAPSAKDYTKGAARTMTVDEMCKAACALSQAKAKGPEGKRAEIKALGDMWPIAIVSNDDNGWCQEVWRNHCLSGGQGAAPKAIRDLFSGGWIDLSLLLRTLGKYQSYHDAQIAEA